MRLLNIKQKNLCRTFRMSFEMPPRSQKNDLKFGSVDKHPVERVGPFNEQDNVYSELEYR